MTAEVRVRFDCPACGGAGTSPAGGECEFDATLADRQRLFCDLGKVEAWAPLVGGGTADIDAILGELDTAKAA